MKWWFFLVYIFFTFNVLINWYNKLQRAIRERWNNPFIFFNDIEKKIEITALVTVNYFHQYEEKDDGDIISLPDNSRTLDFPPAVHLNNLRTCAHKKWLQLTKSICWCVSVCHIIMWAISAIKTDLHWHAPVKKAILNKIQFNLINTTYF